MTWGDATELADALLWEGYLLYPYRSSALKNRYRWQFGIVGPPGSGDESLPTQTECLVEPGANPLLDVRVRFLQVEARTIERLVRPADAWERVETLTVDDRELVTFDEARPRELTVTGVCLDGSPSCRARKFEIEGGREVELVRDGTGAVRARIVRERVALSCTVHVVVEPDDAFRKVRVRIENRTPAAPGDHSDDRATTLRRSLVATHTLLAISDGAFVSLLEPPPTAASRVARCTNLRTWPVLIGRPPERTRMLSTPIILYDYPSVAPESPGDLFDATEIDEMLMLRLQTLGAEERRAAAATDPRARQVIERAASLAPDAQARLHGAVRSPMEELLNPPGSDGNEVLEIGGRVVARGTRVRLRPPPGRADAMDALLVGRTATVAAVYRDLEDRVHVAVVVDDAGAADLHVANGRFYYYAPDEIDVLDEAPGRFTTDTHTVLVAGIGNMFLGDDGFGPAVIQRLASRAMPDGARVEDFGIKGIHLAHAMLADDMASPAHDLTIIIDAVSRGGPAGTLYVLEPDVDGVAEAVPDAHSLSVESVLAHVRQLGGALGRVRIVGCEAGSLEPGIGLSEPVAAAIDGAADLVLRLVAGVD